MKYTYTVEVNYLGQWGKTISDSRDFCLGYLNRVQYESPRLAHRMLRSDGKVIYALEAADDVAIGQIASYPTPEQYEAAAARAIAQAKRIREQQARHDASREKRIS